MRTTCLVEQPSGCVIQCLNNEREYVPPDGALLTGISRARFMKVDPVVVPPEAAGGIETLAVGVDTGSGVTTAGGAGTVPGPLTPLWATPP